jgi:hypothetical protein
VRPAGEQMPQLTRQALATRKPPTANRGRITDCCSLRGIAVVLSPGQGESLWKTQGTSKEFQRKTSGFSQMPKL